MLLEPKPIPTAQANAAKPAARVVLAYDGLPRQSKQFLDKLLQDWAKWHASTYQTEYANGNFEAGRYEYYPAAIAAEDMIVLVDKPDLQTEAANSASSFNLQYETTFEVPKYDRSYDAVLQPARFDKSGEPVEPDLFAKPERRCHNCGSYAHMVQGCPHEKNPNEIRQRTQERGGGTRSSKPYTARYYDSPAGTSGAGDAENELADLKPGQLSSETREALGLGPLDPPPWLDRMRQLGYPPAYKHNKHKHELFIYDDQTGDGAPKNGPRPAEEEEKLQHGQETVMFPGVNAPIPAGANPALWGVPLPHLPSTAGSKRNQPEYPTQEDVAAPPPLKRIRAEEPLPQPFASIFQQPAHASDTAAAPRDPPFVFSAGMQSPGQNQTRHNQQHGASSSSSFGGLPPPSMANPNSQGGPFHNPYASLPYSQPYRNPFTGSVHPGPNGQQSYTGPSLDPARSGGVPSSVPPPPPTYPGFAPPTYITPAEHAASAAQLATSSQSADFYASGLHPPASSFAPPYGVHPPAYPMPGYGMHPTHAAYAAQAAHANLARMAAEHAAAPMPYGCPPQYADPYQQTQTASLHTSEITPPPPPLYLPPFAPF